VILSAFKLVHVTDLEVNMKEKVLDWLLGVGLASVMLFATAL
jgi:hypothetical protein